MLYKAKSMFSAFKNVYLAVTFQSEKLDYWIFRTLNQYKVSIIASCVIFVIINHLLNSLLGTLLLEGSLVHPERVRFQYLNIKCRFVKHLYCVRVG